jgi:hypothetical protein
MFKVYPSSILKPFLLQTEALDLTTEDTPAPFSNPSSSKLEAPMFKVYPSSVLKPYLLQTEALNLATEDTLAPF